MSSGESPVEVAKAVRIDLALAGTVVAFLAFSLVMGAISQGCYHDDDLTHYLMARWSWWYPSYLLHIWGRPGLTVPLAAVSWIGDRFIGWHAARVLSAVVSAATAFVAARLARRMGVRPAWMVVVFCYAQPLAAVLSFTTLTENWTAFYLIAAVSLLVSGRMRWSAALFSLALVTRHEAVIFVPIWWVALAMQPQTIRRRLAASAISLWAPVVHNLSFFMVFREWPVRVYFQPHGSTEYLAGSLLSYIPAALTAMTPVIVALAVAGLRDFWRRDRWIIGAIPIAFLAVHIVIRWRGIFASGGYGRFMVAVGPFVAILATQGLQRIINRRSEVGAWAAALVVIGIGWISLEAERFLGVLNMSSSRQMLMGRGVLVATLLLCAIAMIAAGIRRLAMFRIAAAMCLLIAIAIQWVVIVRPLRQGDDQRSANAVAEWIAQTATNDVPIFATNPWLVYQLGLVEHPRAHKGPQLLASMPEGTLVVWDSRYSDSDFHRLSRQLIQSKLRCQPMWFPQKGKPQSIQFEVFRKVESTPNWVDEELTYPADLGTRARPITGIFYYREP